jgi:3-oxoacyl-(acyl-carrier-protein) synthase
MNPVITGISRLTSKDIDAAIDKHMSCIKEMRLVNDIERLAIASAGNVLEDAKIKFPVGNSDIAIYMGIDDAVEDIKDDYFNNILRDGILGVSPLLFPYTSPNALAAQVSIAFDIRGESITFHIRDSCMDVVKYAAGCVVKGYTKMAIAGTIRLENKKLTENEGRYKAEFFFIETDASAENRGVKKYCYGGMGDTI